VVGIVVAAVASVVAVVARIRFLECCLVEKMAG